MRPFPLSNQYLQPTMSFEALLTAAGGILSNLPFRGPAKTIPGKHMKSLAFDLCLVAGGIR